MPLIWKLGLNWCFYWRFFDYVSYLDGVIMNWRLCILWIVAFKKEKYLFLPVPLHQLQASYSCSWWWCVWWCRWWPWWCGDPRMWPSPKPSWPMWPPCPWLPWPPSPKWPPWCDPLPILCVSPAPLHESHLTLEFRNIQYSDKLASFIRIKYSLLLYFILQEHRYQFKRSRSSNSWQIAFTW